jgi:DNA-directed RNA polymerase specialized sigma24 family protein
MDDSPAPDEHLSRLMARAQQGDSHAYITLLRAIAPRIRQIVRGKRGFLGESDVEDIVQEVLLSVHPVRATYDPARPLMPWLAAIVRHRLADAARRHVRQGAHEILVGRAR